MQELFMPIAAKIGNQKHLVAIRDGFIAIMPITMVGSISVLLNVFVAICQILGGEMETRLPR